jgi:hypothetical protein
MVLVWIIAGVFLLFPVYFFIIIRIRGRKEREIERKKGLDPLR